MVHRRTLLTLCLLTLALARPGQAADLGSLTSSLSDPLLKAVTSQLGVTEDQAAGGIGSYLTLLQEKLNAGDFDKIAKYVPGASKYMDKAKSLGAVTGSLSDMGDLNSALGKLGMAPDTVAKFAPTVTEYLGKLGGDDVQQMLSSALGTKAGALAEEM